MLEAIKKASESSSLNNDDLMELTTLIQNKLDTEAKIRLNLIEAKELIKDHTHLTQNIIPELMQRLNIHSIELQDKTKVSCDPFFAGNISVANKPHAHKWLEDNGHNIVKTEIKVPFDKENKAEYLNFKKELLEKGITFTDSESVHYQTLQAFIKEQMEAGEMDTEAQKLFGVYSAFKVDTKGPNIPKHPKMEVKF